MATQRQIAFMMRHLILAPTEAAKLSVEEASDLIGEFKERPTLPPTLPPKPVIEEADMLWPMQEEFFKEYGYFPDRCHRRKKRRLTGLGPDCIFPPPSDPPPAPEGEDDGDDGPRKPQ